MRMYRTDLNGNLVLILDYVSFVFIKNYILVQF